MARSPGPGDSELSDLRRAVRLAVHEALTRLTVIKIEAQMEKARHGPSELVTSVLAQIGRAVEALEALHAAVARESGPPETPPDV